MRWISIAVLLVGCRPASSTGEVVRPAGSDTPATEVPARPDPRPPCVDRPFPERGPPPHEPLQPTTGSEATLGAVVCRRDREVWRDAQDRVRVCTIAKPVRHHGLPLAGDNYTHFHPDGLPYQTTLARAHDIATGDGTVVPCAAEHLVLHPTGTLEHCTLARATTFGEMECAAGESVGFRADGTLWHCTTTQEVEALDVRFPADTRMAWHADGGLESAYITGQMHVRGWLVRSELEVHASGGLAHIHLAEPRTVGGIALPEFAEVWFFEDGSPWHVEYVAEEGFMIHGEPWSDTRRVTFDCDGRIVADHTEHWQAPSPPPRFRP